MRLSKRDISIIKNVIYQHIDDAKITLFGSRVYDDKKGGDIDIFVETKHNISMKQKLEILTEIEIDGILRKVDMVFKTPLSRYEPIFDTIKREGIVL